MYIKKIELENIRSIDHFIWELPDKRLPGWHVIIGDNGSGKSSLLRAIALALVGVKGAAGLRQNWNDWLTRGKKVGSIKLQIDRNVLFDKSGRQPSMFGDQWGVYLSFHSIRGRSDQIELVHQNPANFNFDWVDTMEGWFSASYGPFRRLAGGDAKSEKLFRSNPRLAAHLSIFGEDIALSEVLRWLQDLKFKQLEKLPEGDLLTELTHFVNQTDFFPHDTKLQAVSSEGVTFIDAKGSQVDIENLSDGYRSILSMTLEIIRQMQFFYPTQRLFSEDHKQVILPGVVLVDEIDAHLHPEWQRTIGYWLTEHFPHIQFIVTTHSPLVCQAAVKGSIWRLPVPGRQQAAYQVDKDNPETAEEWKRLVYGNILEAYSTDLFGEHIDRSPEAQAKFKRLAELGVKELSRALSPQEEANQQALMDELPDTPYKYPNGM